jgi:hypothetical protein
VLEAVLYMMFLDSPEEKTIKSLVPTRCVQQNFPGTMQEAVERIARELPLKTKTYIARLPENKIQSLYFGWMDYLKLLLGLDSGNQALFTRLSQGKDPATFTIEDGVMEIVKSLKQFFETHYCLKVLK